MTRVMTRAATTGMTQGHHLNSMASAVQAGPVVQPLLQVSGIHLGFGGHQVLNGIDMTVAAGRITSLIGPNGAGKTTLFNVLSGLLAPQSGSMHFANEPITGLRPDQITRRGLVRTFQIARGFPRLTVFEHLMLYGQDQPGEQWLTVFVDRPKTGRRESELAEQALDMARQLKLSHVIDNRVGALSGGQKKLLEIGRALMARPRMILLDEPAAGVNPTLTETIGDHLRHIADMGTTILIIEHDMALIERISDHVIVLAGGRVLTEGSFDEVRDNRAVQDAYLGSRQ